MTTPTYQTVYRDQIIDKILALLYDGDAQIVDMDFETAEQIVEEVGQLLEEARAARERAKLAA